MDIPRPQNAKAKRIRRILYVGGKYRRLVADYGNRDIEFFVLDRQGSGS